MQKILPNQCSAYQPPMDFFCSGRARLKHNLSVKSSYEPSASCWKPRALLTLVRFFLRESVRQWIATRYSRALSSLCFIERLVSKIRKMSFAHWVEHIPVFGRPLHIRQTNGTSCTVSQRSWSSCIFICELIFPQGTSAVNVYSICRESAAGTCNPPDNAVTSAGDACVCRTLSAYSSKFMDCIEGPFATCLDPSKWT